MSQDKFDALVIQIPSTKLKHLLGLLLILVSFTIIGRILHPLLYDTNIMWEDPYWNLLWNCVRYFYISLLVLPIGGFLIARNIRHKTVWVAYVGAGLVGILALSFQLIPCNMAF